MSQTNFNGCFLYELIYIFHRETYSVSYIVNSKHTDTDMLMQMYNLIWVGNVLIREL